MGPSAVPAGNSRGDRRMTSQDDHASIAAIHLKSDARPRRPIFVTSLEASRGDIVAAITLVSKR